MAQEGGEALPGGGEPFDGYKGGLGLGQPLGKMGGSGYRGCKPVAQPPNLVFGLEDRPIQVDRGAGYRASVPVRTPVDKLRLGD